ncbi:galactose-1-epimerase [Shimwellia blattae]|uniref:Aldose 1-epimerase n=1 Tax=Shimwellia blattae (strain ATCC 29907 / DSM 4481 / JCM 1650 / NBRC 105725 / CDC 9005-74) TaxID=630626 RepID=I2BB24_SHIBC|nr:galactose-1-epimerase [Shimwellia blattae]AFJ47728.1 aldose 1-epimerase [Shimwellia blattae DSM 4481 = NBRC 105725]GAB79694.1 aldose 1-epimerase [Shimwellia blattae DSM 4481 = NBRC 105725]VDY65225.1 Aldose 1-epimerase [Shimwellia blattae]VEC23951.1 Aldose 1-epimerase [Shimwellia blattae]
MLRETPQLAPDGLPYRLSILRNQAGVVVTMMDWGATLLSCRVPLRDGSVRETLLGCPSPENYLNQSAFLGATVGRYANRIAGSQYVYEGKTVTLQPSQGEHQLHGGPRGFDKQRWRILRQNDSEVLYTLDSPDGDQGFPGNFRTTALYQLTDDNRIRIQFTAWCDQACPVNLTNHAYFNLDATPGDIREHQLQLLADQYLPVDASGIPRRGLADVTGTSFDFRKPKTIGADFLADEDQQVVNGYDHAWLLNARGDATQPAACLWSTDRRLKLTVYTSAPALQFYSGNFLAGTQAREQGEYQNWQGLALESEFLPDSPNNPQWPQPDCFLRPQQEYSSLTEYQFTEQ